MCSHATHLHRIAYLLQSLPEIFSTPFEAVNDCSAAVQRAVKAGLLSSADCDNIIANRGDVAELLGSGDIRQLFANPIEVIAFSDEEGVR